MDHKNIYFFYTKFRIGLFKMNYLKQTIYLLLCLTVSCAVIDAFPFNQGFYDGMAAFNENMRNFGLQMKDFQKDLKQKIQTNMDVLKADLQHLNSLTYKDLPITFSNSSDIHLNFGGCECNGLVCTCCALVEINEDKSDYKMKKNQSGKIFLPIQSELF